MEPNNLENKPLPKKRGRKVGSKNKVKNEYEVGQIINSTQPTLQSLILDVGSGTGDHVAKFTEKNLKAANGIEYFGLKKSI